MEQGRSAYRRHAFTSAKRSLYASVRRRKAAQVHASLRMRRGHVADQGQIWADLAAKAQEHGVESPTFAMSDVFTSRSGDLEAYGRALASEIGQVGAIVYIGSEWWAREFLAGPKLFKKTWERLLPGYAMEALLSSPGGSPVESPEKRMAAILQAPLETFPAVGVGEDHRFQAGGLHGRRACGRGPAGAPHGVSGIDGSMHWLVDGYNVIRRAPELAAYERESLQAGREALCRLLSTAARHSGDRFTVVFDGAQGGGSLPGGPGVRVIFSSRRERADDVLARMARSGGAVVSNDREVRQAAGRGGAIAIPADEFLARLRTPSHPRVAEKEEEEDVERREKKGNPRRLPKKARAASRALRRLGGSA